MIRIYSLIAWIFFFVSCERNDTSAGERSPASEKGEMEKSLSMIMIRSDPPLGVDMILFSKDEVWFEILDTHRNYRVEKSQFSHFFEKLSDDVFPMNEGSEVFIVDLYGENEIAASKRIDMKSESGKQIFWLFFDVFGGFATEFLSVPPGFPTRDDVFFEIVK